MLNITRRHVGVGVIMVSQLAIEQLKQLGFSDTYTPAPQRLIANISAPEKEGKTHLALTGPPPIMFISIDIGTEGVVQKFQEQGKQVYIYEVHYQKGGQQAEYQVLWGNVKAAIAAALAVNEGTLVIDTWTEANELCRLAKLGKLSQVQPHHYGPVNAEMKGIIDDIYSTKMSAALLTKMSKEFGGSEMIEKGWADTGKQVQANLRVSRSTGDDGKQVFSVGVLNCRQNIGMTGMTFSSKQTVEGSEEPVDYFNLSTLIHLVHNWKI